MIVKKIPARPGGRGATVERARHARNLVDYLRLPEKDSPEKAYMVSYMLGQKLGDTSGERLFHIGARGFVSETIEGQRAEMIAVAQEAKRSPNPVDHWLLSWREGELPSAEQVDETVAMFVEHLGVAGQPCIYACHGDTHNRHVHLALNRYDSLARQMIEINDGFTLEAAHQAVALIVDRFGWEAETDARYEVSHDRAILTASAKARIEEGRPPIRQAAAALETRTGYASAQRVAQEEAVPIITAARSWPELHTRLAFVGIAYDAAGTNGATINVAGEKVKSSSVHRGISRTQLEKRLGPFQSRDAELATAARGPDQDRLPEAFRADEYRAEREHWRKLQDEKRRIREIRAAGSRRPDTDLEEARAAARDRASARPAITKRPPPDLESWYYAHREGVFAERWRIRRRVAEFGALTGTRRVDAPLGDEIDGYRPYPCSDGARYARGPDEPTAFIDRGRRVDVVSIDDDALLAALRLAALKFDDAVSVRGTAEFRTRIYEIAKANALSDVLTDGDFVAQRDAERPGSSDRVVHKAEAKTGDEPPKKSIAGANRKSLFDLARETGPAKRPAVGKGPTVSETPVPPGGRGQGR